ncbi:glycosyltransferase family 4 protein [Halosquirtibacter laminarini]|uniref:Glycosyltransferase family 4 protein n=1 Tax=Halosquirtibacter laminarini TaxID=3374600 RepID=A0AC61NE62_9BACT|nr:glycosyltransferase family 4 protein [Prolixibacteraceae bacterium]
MKILHINSQPKWGGGEQQTCDIMEAMTQVDTENILLCTEGSKLEEYCKQRNIQNITSTKIKKDKFKVAKEIVNITNQVEPDIIHIHEKRFLNPLLIAKYIYGMTTKVVYSQKTLISKKKPLSFIKYNNPNIKGYMCVSNAVKKTLDPFLFEKNKEKSKVIYDGKKPPNDSPINAVDLRKKFKIPQDKYLVGNISNHNRSKDLHTFIKTIHHTVNVLKKTDLHFIQIGSPTSSTPKLQKLIKQYGIEDYITMAGFMNEAYNLTPQFDCYLMTSCREGLPHTIMEVFYLGIPVVTTNAGGIPEVVKQDETGLICQIGDFKSLANNIIRLRQEPQLRETIIQNGKQSFNDNFLPSVMANKLLKLYKEAMM